MHIGILKTGHPPDELRADYGDYGDVFATMLSGQGFTFTGYNVVDMEFPASATACDGWLITGSRHGAYEDHAFIPPLEDLIRKAYAADVPMVGVCFGHQIIAQALGGKVEKFDGGWAVGRQTYVWNGQEVSLNAWHQDQVTVAPEAAKVCASDDFCANAALIYGQKAFTVQAHPEYDSGFMAGLAKYRGALVPHDQLQTLAANLDKTVDNDRLTQQISQFFKERAIA